MGMCLDHQRDYQIWHRAAGGKPSLGESPYSQIPDHQVKVVAQ